MIKQPEAGAVKTDSGGLGSFGPFRLTLLPVLAVVFPHGQHYSAVPKKNIDAFVADTLSDSDLWGTVRWAIGLKDSLSDLLWRLFESVVDDLLNHDATAVQSVANLVGLGIDGGLLQSHYSEITLAWMMSMDSYYTDGVDKTDSNQLTRIVHINCPVDVRVYDSNSNLVASILSDEAQTITGSTIPAFINVDGEKIVMLPTDEDYRIQIEATDDGNVNVAINEFYYGSSSINRLLNYHDIPVNNGDIITAIIPQLDETERTVASENGSTSNYEVLNNENESIIPDDLYSGDNAQATYNVSVGIEGDNGIVTGGGEYTLGNFAQIQAFPKNGASFLGWYENDVLVSSDELFRFSVNHSAEYTAKFGNVETFTLSFATSVGGSVENVDIEIPAGTQVNTVAIADSGYVFKMWKATSGAFDDVLSSDTWFTMPNDNVVITAIFEEKAITSNEYNITFDANGGSCPITSLTTVNQKLTVLPTATHSGDYSFDGWFTAVNGGTPINAFTVFSSDTTVYAHWTKNNHYVPFIPTIFMVTFDTNGGSSIDKVYGTYGIVIDLDKYVPTKDGFDFGGWYNDKALSTPIEDIQITGNMTVYAKWIEINKFPFIDVFKSDTFYDDVAYVYNNDLMIGVSDTLFAPYTTLSRGMIVTILYRLDGEPAFMNDNIFTDVEAGSWYENAVVWANSKGIVLGYGDGRYGPNDPVTREQMAAILYRYAQYKGYNVSIDKNTNFLSFDDFFNIDEYAQAPMSWTLSNNLIDDVNGWLYPRDNATRAVVATFFHRFCEAFVK